MPPPPYSSGSMNDVSPSAAALYQISHGISVSASSTASAIGRISFPGELPAERLDLALLRCQLDELGRHWARFSLIRCSARESQSGEISTPQPGPSGVCTRPSTTRGRGSYIPTCHG